MKCKDIEQMIIGLSGKSLDAKQSDTIQRHIEHCTRCSRFKEDVENMRSLMQQRTEPILPEDLDRKTYQMCLDEMQSLQNDSKIVDLQTRLQTIPLYMKFVLASLLAVMAIWFFSLFENFGAGGGENLTIPTYIGLFLIFQNAMMLLFSPLLIRRFRSKKLKTQCVQ